MKTDNVLFIALICALVLLSCSLFYSGNKACDTNINYTANIIGTNSTNNGAEIMVMCFELCIKEMKGSDNFNRCLDACEKLKVKT